MRILLLTLSIITLSLFTSAQVTSISGTINIYTSVSGIAGNTITVGSSTGFSVGDKILIIQMQGATIDESNSATFGNVTNFNDAGNYEFTTICSIPNATEIVLNGIQRSYTPAGIVQVVHVPVYTNALITASLTADPWDGTTGGIVVFECTGSVTMNSGINLQGNGFRGGGVTNSTYSCSAFGAAVNDYFYPITTGEGAKKGEGIANYISGKTGGRGAQANGAGGANDHNAGGGGGGNAGSGGQGGERIASSVFTCSGPYPGLGGKLIAYTNNSNKIFLGGGGGAGHENNINSATSGMNGGGIVIISADSIIGNGNSINVNGLTNTLSSFDGAGGAGAGGSVLLNVSTYIGTLNIDATGGDGGVTYNSGSSNCNGPGGGGGGGLLWVNQATQPANIVLSNTGGAPGVIASTSQSNCTLGSTNNATAGTSGAVVTSLVFVETTCSITSTAVSASICSSDSLFVGGAWQTTNGVYTDTLTSGCCDSIVETTLSVTQNLTGTLTQTICAGESIVVNGTTYSSSVTGATETFTTASCDSIVTINLTVLPPKTGTITETICTGESIVVNGTTYSSTVSGATETFSNVGPYNCDSTVTINLTVETVDITVTDASPTLTSNATGATYQWINCPSLTQIVGETNQSFTATATGDYAVIVTNGSCSDTSACSNVTVMGIIENGFGEQLQLFPNPTDGEFMIDLGDHYNSVTITITSLDGQLVSTTNYMNAQSLNLNLDRPAGVYFMMIETEYKKALIRLVRE